jgi:hypothetical protein
MTANIVMVDRIVRLVIGIALIAFALGIGFPKVSWSWVGWIGIVPILTALFGHCPGYRLFGLSTCPLAHSR